MTEPWIIICETCQSKLRVRSAEAVGAILACPKCQSLVRIAPPTAPTEPASSAPPSADHARAEPGKAASTRWTWTWTGGATALVLAIGVAAVLWTGRDPATAEADLSAAGNDAEATPSGPYEARAADNAVDPVEAPEPPREDLAPAATAEAVQGRPSDGPPADAPPPLPDLPVGVGSLQASQQPSRTVPERSARRNVPPIGLGQFDFSFEPEQSAVAAADAPAVTRDAPNGGAKDQASESEEDGSAPKPPASSSVRMTVARVEVDADLPAPPDPKQALALPLENFTIDTSNRMSPLTIVRLIAEMTGTTITFRPEAYAAIENAPTTAAGPVQFSQKTAGEVLGELLQRHGLEIATRGSHLIVLPRGNRGPDRTSARRLGELSESGPIPRKLRQHVTFSFTQGALLSEVLQHVEQAAGLAVLVDWESLASVGLGPATEVTASAVDQPLLDVLNGLLPQLDIDWAAVGNDALWLTARRQGS